jgi:hypothetical protein
VTSQTQANVGGSWFGNPGTSPNKYAAYGWVMGLPTPSVQSNDLTSSTLNTQVYDSLQSSGSSIFGAGVLGANYSAASTGTYTYTASNTHEYALSGGYSITLGLLTIGAYNNGFKTLTFTVAEGATTLFTKSFSTLSQAQAYFTDDPVVLGNLSGPIDLTLTYKLTANAPEGAGISYLVADGPPVSSAHVSLADVDGAWHEEARPHQGLMATAPRSSLFSAMRAIFDSAAQVGANEDVARFPGLRTPEPIRATQLIKAQRR